MTDKKITDYKIVCNQSPEDLASEVGYLVRSESWQPYGELIINAGMHFQALVQYKK